MGFSDWLLINGGNLQVGLFFGLLALLIVAELYVPARRGRMMRRQRWTANFGLTTLNLVLLGALPLSFISVAAWADANGYGVLNLLALPTPVVVLATLLLRALLSFVTHWMSHKIEFLWRIHRVHHLDTELDVSTTVRGHPAEFIVNLAIAVPFVVGFGLSPWVLAAYEVLDVCITLWSHANVRIPASVDRALRYVVVTPNLHRIHHSSWQPETDSNFGAVFPVWDLVFGTFRASPRTDHETMKLGLNEVRGTNANRLTWLLSSPLRKQLTDASAAPIGTLPGGAEPL